MHVRYSTVLVIVVLLMGSVLYEVTRTEAIGRQSTARTQDIALPAPQPVVHTVRASANFIGNSSMGRSAILPVQPDRELLATAAYGSVTVTRAAFFSRDVAPRGFGSAFYSRSVNGRPRSSGSAGFAAGAYGMGGVGAWGGVSGVMRPISNLADRPGRRVGQTRTSTPTPRRNNGNGSRGGTSSGNGNSQGDGGASLPGGFTTGVVEPGTVVDVTPGSGGVTPRSPAPAPTPEPMSMLLVGTGLAALYKVRQHLQ